MSEFIKLRDIERLNIESFRRVTYKMWDPGERKMQVENEPFKGSKKYLQFGLEDGNIIELTQSQYSQILGALIPPEVLANKSVGVSNNGKEGMEIRYFFNKLED
jgi:hypothetical protein